MILKCFPIIDKKIPNYTLANRPVTKKCWRRNQWTNCTGRQLSGLRLRPYSAFGTFRTWVGHRLPSNLVRPGNLLQSCECSWDKWASWTSSLPLETSSSLSDCPDLRTYITSTVVTIPTKNAKKKVISRVNSFCKWMLTRILRRIGHHSKNEYYD